MVPSAEEASKEEAASLVGVESWVLLPQHEDHERLVDRRDEHVDRMAYRWVVGEQSCVDRRVEGWTCLEVERVGRWRTLRWVF